MKKAELNIAGDIILKKAVRGIMELGIEFSYGIKRTEDGDGDGYEISITNISAPEWDEEDEEDEYNETLS